MMKRDDSTMIWKFHSSGGNRASFCTISVTLATQTWTIFFRARNTGKVLLVPVTGGVNDPPESSATPLVLERHGYSLKGLATAGDSTLP